MKGEMVMSTNWNEKLKKWWGNRSVRLCFATLFLTVGVYVAFPEMGFLATLPLLPLISFFVFFFFSKVWLIALLSTAIAMFYGVTANLPDPATFSVVCFLSSLLGALAGKGILLSKGKWWILLIALPVLVLSSIPTFFYAGTPTSYLTARQKAETFLANRYPQQEFSQIRFHYDLRARHHRALLYYDYEGNTLTSEVYFEEDGVKDGFFHDYTEWMMEKRKSQFIGLFQKKGYSVVTEVQTLSEPEEGAVYSGYYGSAGEEWLKTMRFSITFREEKPDRREFADACSQVLSDLQENKLVFDSVTFYALDAGKVCYRCCLSYESDPQSALSEVVQAQ